MDRNNRPIRYDDRRLVQKLKERIMPNWCLNRLTVEHEDSSKVDELENAYRNNNTCENFLPTPKDPKDPTKLLGEGEALSGEMPEWYHYRVANWGTKWDFGCQGEYDGMQPTRTGNELSMRFDTAWSPPLGLYERLRVLGFKVNASYFEPGMQFGGFWVDGKDDCTEGADLEDFPQKLIEEYDIAAYLTVE